MNRNNKIHSTTIRVHPAVFRYLDVTFNKIGDAYDLRGHIFYSYLTAGLIRKGMKLPTMMPLPKQYEKMLKIKVVIASWDYHHFGWDIPPFHQVALSNHIYKQILFDGCYRVMISHVFGNLPRDTAIKSFLSEHSFLACELNYAALRKHYQRHWLKSEKLIKENVADFNSISPHILPTNSTKKNVGIVPFRMKQKKID